MLCRPRALRVSDSTMTMRVKLVIIMSSAGAIDRSVRATMIVTLSDGLFSVLPRLIDTLPGWAAPTAPGAVGAVGAVGGVGAVGVTAASVAAAGVAVAGVAAGALGVG